LVVWTSSYTLTVGIEDGGGTFGDPTAESFGGGIVVAIDEPSCNALFVITSCCYFFSNWVCYVSSSVD
jgi:hypothetical protein